jgi:hypothetical protein
MPLDQTQVSLVAGVLHHAAQDCRAADTPEAPENDGSVITLGGMARRWTAIAEREEYCDVINVHGERLYNVSLTLEGWYQVRAALSQYAARLTRFPPRTAAARDDRGRAQQALLLAHRITEATRG